MPCNFHLIELEIAEYKVTGKEGIAMTNTFGIEQAEMRMNCTWIRALQIVLIRHGKKEQKTSVGRKKASKSAHASNLHRICLMKAILRHSKQKKIPTWLNR